MRVSVVGLGPGPLDWVTPPPLARLRLPRAPAFVRTGFFPNLERLLEGVEWQSFDDLYERSESLADVEMAMAERLLEAAEGDVVLGVPGDGVLGEAVLTTLREGGAVVEVVPGVPLGGGALAAAGRAARHGAQLG